MKRPAGVSRKVLDPVNSVAWYAMDGFWLISLAWPAYAAAAVTLASGVMLLALHRRRGPRLNDDLALNSWMWMNALWVISDLEGLPGLRHAAVAVGGLGAILLANAVRPSMIRQGALKRFRKMRVSGNDNGEPSTDERPS